MPGSRSHTVRRGGLVASLALAALCIPPRALAADFIPPGPGSVRPRIGLALSGGGARGIAHVGVLKVLDELRIPIDCVTGTSMGAIVGGAFAAGTPPVKLEELVLAADWEQIFRDQPPRGEISFRRKSDDVKTLFAPEFGVKDGGLALPKGVVAGVSIEAFFRRLAEPAMGINDFRKLPIPFRALATDIETGESVVLDRGSVAQAMRASMAVPGAIAPVEIDGRLLVDGGIANNLPIDEARRLCADAVIAVNISTPPLKRADLTSALTVAGQLINFLGKQTVDAQLKSMTANDVLIEPALGAISAASFARARDAIRIGEEATRAMAGALERYRVPPEQYAALRARQLAERKVLGVVDEIRFEGLERTNPAVLRGLLSTRPGEPLAEEKIGADLRRIYGRGDFESIDYHIADDGGPRAMVITPREKLWGPDYLRFGIGLASDFQGDNAYNLLTQYRRTWLNRLGGEWLAEGQVGQDTHLAAEFYQPLHEAGTWFMSVHGSVGQTKRSLFNGEDRIADYLVGVVRTGVDVGALLGTMGSVRVGASWGRGNARVETGDPVLPSVRDVSAGLRANIVFDQLDRAWFARGGYNARLSVYSALQSFGSASAYQRMEAAASAITSWGPHTLNLYAAGGTDFGSNMPAYEAFTLGGPLRLSGFHLDQFAARQYAFGRAMYYNRVFRLPDVLGSGVFVGAAAEAGWIRDRYIGPQSPATLFSGSVFVGAYVGVGWGTGGALGVYLLLGAP
jgi:NTE family protein